MAYILSVHWGGNHDSAAALFDDYEIIGAIQKERLTRTKKDGGEPKDCIDDVLALGGISISDVDVVVFTRSQFPRAVYKTDKFRQIRDLITKSGQTRDLSTVMSRNGTEDPNDVIDTAKILSRYGLRKDVKVYFTNHHFAHAIPSLFFTDWDNALLYTSDGAGDNVNHSHRVYKDGRLDTLFGDDRWLCQPYRIDSLARAYANVTEAIGFRPLHHEGKVTGLAAFGTPVLRDAFAAHFDMDEDGRFSSDFADGKIMRETVMALCHGQTREDASASIQAFVEDKIAESVALLMEKHGVRHLGLAGGLFANVKLNQRLARHADEIFIVPPMGDEGLVIGGALAYLHERDGFETWLKQRYRLRDVYWGRGFSADTGRRLADYSPRIRRLPGTPEQKAAELMHAGKAVAIFTARTEFGPRALGARSIMASPLRRDINDSLNQRLDRSEFMPFAPVIAAEDARAVFDVTDANAYACRFMTITCDVKAEWSDRIPAVVHVDNTARPQIIERADNPLYYDVLANFKTISGLPAAVNTSFNVHEEPIINTPEEAARALVDDRVDYLVTEDGVFGIEGRL
jgi:carbamoyltransferase